MLSPQADTSSDPEAETSFDTWCFEFFCFMQAEWMMIL